MMKISDRKSRVYIFGILLLASAILVAIVGAIYYADNQYRILSNLTQHLINKYPEDEHNIIKLIKDNIDIYDSIKAQGGEYLPKYGYEPQDFVNGYIIRMIPFLMVCIITVTGLLAVLIKRLRKRQQVRINHLTKCLVKLNMGKEVALLPNVEDAYSGLQNEIHKTVTMLYKSKEKAIIDKKNYADNLANIAHQMKTPLTSISLIVQMLNTELKEEYKESLLKQVERLTKLEEALLLLSRIDAGVLQLEQEEVDVYTMLQLTVEGLAELQASRNLNTLLEIQENVSYRGDMEWSIEAFTNLIKNCMEHAKKEVTIDYSSNPIYTEIKVWDDGEGIANQDIAHIFERFYRGNRAIAGGIGIGLSLSKSIISLQNGCIEVKNIPGKGACFITRFYCH